MKADMRSTEGQMPLGLLAAGDKAEVFEIKVGNRQDSCCSGARRSDGEAHMCSMAIKKHLAQRHPSIVERYPLRWLSFKLMENDAVVMDEAGIGDDAFLTGATQHLRKIPRASPPVYFRHKTE